jgi:hypothetical protein
MLRVVLKTLMKFEKWESLFIQSDSEISLEKKSGVSLTQHKSA